MHQPSVLVLLTVVLSTSTALGAQQVYLSGAALRPPCSDPLAIHASTYSAVLSFLIGQRPGNSVDSESSAQVGLDHNSASIDGVI